DMKPGSTMMLEWTPSHPGRWLFHCHFMIHIAPTVVRVPLYSRRFAGLDSHPVPMRMAADPQNAMDDMAGMIMVIHVKAKPGAYPGKVARHPRKIALVLQPDSPEGKSQLISCSIHEGDK